MLEICLFASVEYKDELNILEIMAAISEIAIRLIAI
jgi:hypothetical protein